MTTLPGIKIISQNSTSRKRNLEAANGTIDGPPSKKSRESAPDLTMVFVVMHTNYLNDEVYEAKPLDVYLSLEDANRRVRNEFITWGDRDDPDADFQEGILGDGRIWWKWRDETGYGYDTDVHCVLLRPPGSEPVRDWGRDIGEPCPEKSDSEVDSSDEESNSSMLFIS